ncbi:MULTISPECIES: hypothetical protein [Streptomyces]|uniref:Secreted protein n=1 Tax=Streptomyces tricolor TaxID=68277 RepID=A0ABS9JJZ1_9ACTN|nr:MULTISPECIES: hypothetical protein [Streptomyces]MCG0065890.1 hypothetical protein [Streptomyces tricolor]OYP17473.1 hypothetical protein CFC35_25690 [Streptomyces sp. FBKL.4005]CUW28652.1 hypothetical protein TUE45_03373 [Streptomyces reticuli]
MDSGAIRRRPRRRLALAAAVLAVSGAFALTATGTAQAAGPAGGCAGREVKTLPFKTGVTHVYKRNGYICAVTVARTPGPLRTMSVSVQARGNRPVVDKGRFRQHAGPVTVHAGRRCVWIKGSVGRYSVSSGWILC